MGINAQSHYSTRELASWALPYECQGAWALVAGRWQPYSQLHGHLAVLASQSPAQSAAAFRQVCRFPCERQFFALCVSPRVFFLVSASRVEGTHTFSLRPFADLKHTVTL